MKLKILFLKIRLKYFPKKAGKYDFNKILEDRGISIGKGTIFYDPNSIIIDRERPWMLKIGEYCKITRGTVILTHDYSRSVLRRVYGDVIGEARKTIIGDNVFIGINSIILMGAHIGNNVIIGAGSVVSGHIPDNCVIAGNPARIIRSLDEHYNIRKEKSEEEAIIYFNEFKKKYNRNPSVAEMGPFFSLFLPRKMEMIKKEHVNVNLNGDEKEDVINCFLKSKAKYNSYEEFIRNTNEKEDKA